MTRHQNDLRFKSVNSVSHDDPNEFREKCPKQRAATQIVTYLLLSPAFPQLESQTQVSEAQVAQPNLTSDHHTPRSQAASQPVNALNAKQSQNHQSIKPTAIQVSSSSRKTARQTKPATQNSKKQKKQPLFKTTT